jgi:hypothetical protein
MASGAGLIGDGAISVAVAVCSAAPAPESGTMEQQPPLADPTIVDVEQLPVGSEQDRDAAGSQQHTGCATSPLMLHA